MPTRVPPEAPRPAAPRVPALVWLGLPLVCWLAPYAGKAIGDAFYERWVRTEFGFVEMATNLVLVAAVGFGVLASVRAPRSGLRWLRPAYALLTLGCFYFLGEEVSWLDHVVQWQGAESLRAHNDQGETNLHNLPGLAGTLLDQLPRALLTLGALVGGVIAPLVLRNRPELMPRLGGYGAWIVPGIACLPSAALALVASKLVKFTSDLAPWLDIRGGESKELLLACLLALYLCERARQLRPPEVRDARAPIDAVRGGR